MNGYIAFVKKEFIENMKKYRFPILFAVFLVFGIMSAFLAKFTLEILSALAADMEMTPEPLALDAWKQFYKNLSPVAFAAFSLWIMGFLYLSILMIGCVIFKQTFTSILFTSSIVALISLLGMIEPTSKFNPFILKSKNVDLISREVIPAEFIIPAFISVVLSIFFWGVLIAIHLSNQIQQSVTDVIIYPFCFPLIHC